MENKKSLLQLNLSVILFGLAGLFAKWILLPSIVITFGRVFFSSIILNGYRLFHKEKAKIEHSDSILFIILGIVLAYHWWSFLESIQRSTVAIGTISYSTFPLFVIIIETLLMHKKQSVLRYIEALFVILGVIVLSQGSIQSQYLSGLLIGLSSSFAYAILTLLNQKLSKKYASNIITCFEQTTACIILLPIILFTVKFQLTLSDILLLMILGIFMTAIAHSLFVSSLKYTSATVASIISVLESPYSILFAMIFLKEIPTVYEIAGCMIIIFAAILTQFEPSKK